MGLQLYWLLSFDDRSNGRNSNSFNIHEAEAAE